MVSSAQAYLSCNQNWIKHLFQALQGRDEGIRCQSKQTGYWSKVRANQGSSPFFGDHLCFSLEANGPCLFINSFIHLSIQLFIYYHSYLCIYGGSSVCSQRATNKRANKMKDSQYFQLTVRMCCALFDCNIHNILQLLVPFNKSAVKAWWQAPCVEDRVSSLETLEKTCETFRKLCWSFRPAGYQRSLYCGIPWHHHALHQPVCEGYLVRVVNRRVLCHR